ncbi:MAG: hypothetical protein RIR52_566, partial [Acidobacteriota bacterium]
PRSLELARELGAEVTVDARGQANPQEAVIEATRGGAHLSIDALGSINTCIDSILSLRRRGRHVQVGLMAGEHAAPSIPMGRVIGYELEILGSHGMQAHRYDAVFGMLSTGKLQPGRLIQRRITLADSIETLVDMDQFRSPGVTVITSFGQ